MALTIGAGGKITVSGSGTAPTVSGGGKISAPKTKPKTSSAPVTIKSTSSGPKPSVSAPKPSTTVTRNKDGSLTFRGSSNLFRGDPFDSSAVSYTHLTLPTKA